MPIEKAPRIPLAINYIPTGSRPYRVKANDDLHSIAKANGISEAQLLKFNFNTTDAAEVNWYLRRTVGCKKATADGKNWMFTSDATPGIIYIPIATIPRIFIRHRVTLFAQPTNMTCWSAAATMLFGNKSIGSGAATVQSSGGMNFNDQNMETFARGQGLKMYYPQSWTVDGLAGVLEKGPIMVAGGLIKDARGITHPHAVVIGGMVGDGSPGRTFCDVYDPWPPGRGFESHNVSYQQIMLNFPQATTYILQR
jgi:hypothetical protein